MKKILLFLCTILCANVLLAQDFYVNEVGYAINGDEVSVIGYDSNLPNELEIPSTVTNNGITYSVTSIGDYAFLGCNNLTSIDIPNGVTSIGGYAFKDCGNLTSVTIPNSVTSIGERAFYDCRGLTSVTIPNSVTSIGSYAFDGCSSLTSIDIPNGVTSIGNYTFYNCSSLTSIDIPNSVTSIGDHAFNYCSSLTSVNIPNSVTSIGEYAFYHCSSLTSIDIPNGVTSIGNGAFHSCSSLTSIDIPNSVTSIGSGAFAYCSTLTSITIPNSVTSIGEGAFYSCDDLTSVTCLAETAPSLGSDVFYNTPSTKVLNIPCGSDYSYWESATTWASVECTWDLGNSLTYFPLTFAVISEEERTMKVSACDASATVVDIPARVIYNGELYYVTSIGSGAFNSCFRLTSVTIPNSVTSIGDYAFYTCSRLTSVTIPNSVTSIGVSAFEDCTSLTSVTIPNSLTSIGYSAFRNCSSLTSVTIPNSVTSIGNSAFAYCSSLTSVILPNNANIYSSAFESTGGINVDGIYYGGKETVNIGNYTFNNVGFITFYLNGNATTITPSEVSVIDCDESLSGDIVIPSILSYQGINIAVTSIGDYAFWLSSLTSVTIPNSVTSIGNFAFRLSSLTSVTIPNSVTSIGRSAFSVCSRLTSVTIPNSVTSIGDYAFYTCSRLTSVTIPNSVTSIGGYAFEYCSSLTSVTCLKETAPSLGSNVFSYTPSTKVLNIPFGSNYSAWQSATTWAKTNYQIQKGKTKILETDFTINSTTGLINQGVLRIKQSGQLINQTGTNVSGIFEVETPTLANNKWSFIGAPFNNYKLEAVKPGTKDISISLFDYETGNWSNDFATIEDVVGAGEGFFAWSFAAEPTVFTTYGDGAETYNFENTPEYKLNNGAVTVTKTLKTHKDGGNWLALSNPYTFKLDVNKFLSEHGDIKGEVVYRFNGETWDAVQAGVINMTEGFFVNYETEGAHGVSFSKYHRPGGTKKADKQREYISLYMQDGERTTKLLITQNEEAEQGDDIFDANKLFSPLEITEPYFVTDGVALVKEEVKELPYYATLNIKNYDSKEVTFRVDNIPEDVYVYLLDNGQDIKMNGGVKYTTNIAVGENEDRFKLLIKKARRIAEEITTDIYVHNSNRYVTITTTQKDLKIEVYNTLGQKVFETNKHNFYIDNVPSGTYILKIHNKHARKNAKIVIE